MSKVGTELELAVDGVAHGGWCVGRIEQQVVFVRHALPGERVRVRVTEETARFLRADVVEVVDPSPERVTPPCPYAGPGRCGGCDWQHASLAEQRRIKARVVTEQLRRIAGIQLPEFEVEEIPGADDGLGWRTRVRYAVNAEGRAGFRRHRSHDVQTVDDCLIAHSGVRELGVTRLPWPGIREIEATASATTADRAVVVTPEGAKLPTLPQLETSSAVLRRFKGGRTQQVRGRRGVREHVGGREWRISAGGFWQGHPGAAGVLSEAVLAALEPKPGEAALDLYCGAGLFAGALAEAVGPEGRVLAVERDPQAVRDAERNLRDLPNVQVEVGDAASRLRGWADLRGSTTTAVLDPPRAGAGSAVVAGLSAVGARRVAYVSCDPATLARDLAAFAKSGFRLNQLRAFDAFPMTHHVECLAELVRE
ncbi:class I SAM-dependent RNA methyltransferase [Spiractinospora alimapuensis]|uniref:class I SAM-dependent RNA methyltransferase n=1 Tax=Spiractinospora alimapuensis TaxID=2820884 RepID=UPI001F15DC7E|nr:class I SAM-dependent RNA methyltransferase [Spiractinospora alimapuensis]QVQ52398.1 class I SAM-dependent RNA methyltransferase [Spiractinospora alimapuensis]